MARLVDNGDGTVFDTETQLIWQQTPPEAKLTWKQAKSYASKEKLAGGGWRVPSMFELESLRSLTVRDKQLLEHYEDWFWSSTLLHGDPETAWSVYIYYDSYVNSIADGHRVRCVR